MEICFATIFSLRIIIRWIKFSGCMFEYFLRNYHPKWSPFDTFWWKYSFGAFIISLGESARPLFNLGRFPPLTDFRVGLQKVDEVLSDERLDRLPHLLLSFEFGSLLQHYNPARNNSKVFTFARSGYSTKSTLTRNRYSTKCTVTRNRYFTLHVCVTCIPQNTRWRGLSKTCIPRWNTCFRMFEIQVFH